MATATVHSVFDFELHTQKNNKTNKTLADFMLIGIDWFEESKFADVKKYDLIYFFLYKNY